MKIAGIIAEYNPFHNGHLYHLNTIKEQYKDYKLTIEKIQLNQTKKETDIDRTKMWLKKQVAQSLGKVALLDGDMEFIDKITVEGAKKLKRSGFDANNFN